MEVERGLLVEALNNPLLLDGPWSSLTRAEANQAFMLLPGRRIKRAHSFTTYQSIIPSCGHRR